MLQDVNYSDHQTHFELPEKICKPPGTMLILCKLQSNDMWFTN